MALFFKDVSSDIVTILVVALTAIYFYFKYTFSYWQRRGVKYIPPTSPLGNFGETFLQKKSMGIQAMDYYRRKTEPFIGLFAIIRPVLLVRDLDLIRHILIKDFQYFTDRGVASDEKKDPLLAHLFTLPGDKWKNLRVKLSPTFTSGKLKAMFSTLIDCGKSLREYMDNAASKGETIELRELSAQYTTTVVASTAFGVDIDAIKDPNTAFRKYGRQFFAPTVKNGLRFGAIFLFPKIVDLLKIRLVDRDVEDFMMSLVQQTLEHRENNNVVRKDLFQLLLQLRNSGNVQLDDEWETVITAGEKGKKLTIAEMAAQSFGIFVAAFETTSSTMSFCLFEIARNADIQRRVHQEIDEVLARHDGKITYESANEMRYLETCIEETLRKYPSLPILNRECTKDYKVPGTDIVLEKGTAILIPAMALQHDENYFPNPSKFDPDRFADKCSAPSMSYLPFGDGPHNCIGMRLGKMQTKVGLILMLQKCQFELGEPEYYHKELSFSPAGTLLIPQTGIQLKISPR